jgi:hypothetical protein
MTVGAVNLNSMHHQPIKTAEPVGAMSSYLAPSEAGSASRSLVHRRFGHGRRILHGGLEHCGYHHRVIVTGDVKCPVEHS